MTLTDNENGGAGRGACGRGPTLGALALCKAPWARERKLCLQWTHASPQLYPCPPRQGRKRRCEIKLGSRTQTHSLSDRLHADPSEVQATFSRNRCLHRGHGLCQPSQDVGFAQSERGKDLPNRGTGRSKGGKIRKFTAHSRNSKTSKINPGPLRSESRHRFSPRPELHAV